MKYEITKGAKEEFELAPEWATLVVAGRHYSKAWISHYANGARALAFGTKDEYVIDAIDDCEVIAERRPITEPVWDGEGLPPVGVECEVKRALDWMKCKILFISDHHVVLTSEEEICWQTQACQFRPIRSPEDVARDAGIKKIMATFKVDGELVPDNVAEAMWDAGYRKME